MSDSSLRRWLGSAVGAWLAAVAPAGSAAEKIDLNDNLTAAHARCLDQLFWASDWSISPGDEKRMFADARVGRGELNGSHREQYLFLIEGPGWCGTAGCPLLIGEVLRGGPCHLRYDGMGFDNITVLPQRDRGYHRLYTPCEIRYDGRRYRQLRAQCPNPDVER